MGTSYTVVESPCGAAIEIHEHSNKFDLSFEMELGSLYFRDLTAEQLDKIGNTFLTVASYYPDEDESTLEQYKIPYANGHVILGETK